MQFFLFQNSYFFLSIWPSSEHHWKSCKVRISFFYCYLHHISIKMVCHMQLQIINKEFKIQWTSKNPANIGWNWESNNFQTKLVWNFYSTLNIFPNGIQYVNSYSILIFIPFLFLSKNLWNLKMILGVFILFGCLLTLNENTYWMG